MTHSVVEVVDSFKLWELLVVDILWWGLGGVELPRTAHTENTGDWGSMGGVCGRGPWEGSMGGVHGRVSMGGSMKRAQSLYTPS